MDIFIIMHIGIRFEFWATLLFRVNLSQSVLK